MKPLIINVDERNASSASLIKLKALIMLVEDRNMRFEGILY